MNWARLAWAGVAANRAAVAMACHRLGPSCLYVRWNQATSIAPSSRSSSLSGVRSTISRSQADSFSRSDPASSPRSSSSSPSTLP